MMKRTPAIEKLLSKVEGLQAEFDEMLVKRQDAFDSKSEKWQESEKGEEEQENISALEEIKDLLEDASNKIQDIFEEQ